MTVAGHSFGSWIALRAAASAPGELLVTHAVLLAPSTRLFAFSEGEVGFAGTTSIFVGTDDEYCDVDEAKELGRRLRADRVRVFEGFDHQFTQGRRRVAEAALSSLAPEVDS
jgi:pimeloyl-ACP methyl ester carboxylesterase